MPGTASAAPVGKVPDLLVVMLVHVWPFAVVRNCRVVRHTGRPDRATAITLSAATNRT